MFRFIFLILVAAAFLFGMRTERHLTEDRCMDAGGRWSDANLCEGWENG